MARISGFLFCPVFRNTPTIQESLQFSFFVIKSQKNKEIIMAKYPNPDDIAKIILDNDEKTINSLLAAAKNDNSQEAKIFNNYYGTIRSVLIGNVISDEEIFFLQNLDKIIKDPEIRHQMRREIIKNHKSMGPQITHFLMTQNANDKNASDKDIIDLLFFEWQNYKMRTSGRMNTETKLTEAGESNLRISKDFFERLKRELIEERTKDVPDLEKIKSIMDFLNPLMYNVGNQLHEYELSKKMRQSIDEITNNDAKYVAKYPEIQEAQIIDMGKRVADAEQTLDAERRTHASEMKQSEQEIARLQKIIDSLTEENNKYATENKRLNGMVRDAQSKTANAEETTRTTKEKLDKLIAGSKKMKSGLGSRGVKNYQKLVSQVATKSNGK